MADEKQQGRAGDVEAAREDGRIPIIVLGEGLAAGSSGDDIFGSGDDRKSVKKVSGERDKTGCKHGRGEATCLPVARNSTGNLSEV